VPLNGGRLVRSATIEEGGEIKAEALPRFERVWNSHRPSSSRGCDEGDKCDHEGKDRIRVGPRGRPRVTDPGSG